jgi:hypothetical protein
MVTPRSVHSDPTQIWRPSDSGVSDRPIARAAPGVKQFRLRIPSVGLPLYAMELKNAHVAVDTTTEMVVIEGKCPSCYRGIRRPLDSFRQLGYLCECGTTVTPPEGLEALLDAAIKKAKWRRQTK